MKTIANKNPIVMECLINVPILHLNPTILRVSIADSVVMESVSLIVNQLDSCRVCATTSLTPVIDVVALRLMVRVLRFYPKIHWLTERPVSTASVRKKDVRKQFKTLSKDSGM
jgi:hypothetical protein